MRTPLLFAIAVILAAGMAPAGEDAAPPPPVKWSGSVNFGWTQSTGNTESMSASISAAATRKAKRTLLEAAGQAHYGETEGEQTTDKGEAGARFSYFHTPRFFSYGEGGVYYDDFRRLDVGTRLGAGIGRKFVDTERTALSGRIGIAWTAEEYMEGTDDERYTSATAGMDFSHKLTDTLAVTMKTAAGMDIDDSDNWTLKSEAALASTLTKNLSLIVSVTHAYDNDPPPGVKENDVTVMTALGFAF